MKKIVPAFIALALIFLHTPQALCEPFQNDSITPPAPKTKESITVHAKWPALKTFYTEAFTDEGSVNRSIWLLGQDKAGWKGSVSGGLYQLENYSDQKAVKFFYAKINEINPDNDAVSVDTGMDAEMKGPYSRVGLIYRLNPSDKTYYAFVLTGGTNYAFAKRDAKGYRELLKGSHATIKHGSLNRLGIIGIGPSMALYINGGLVKIVRDASLKGNISGAIAISTGKFRFDNFSLGKAPEAKSNVPGNKNQIINKPGNNVMTIEGNDSTINEAPLRI